MNPTPLVNHINHLYNNKYRDIYRENSTLFYRKWLTMFKWLTTTTLSSTYINFSS